MDWSNIIGISSVIIAVCALLLSVWQGYLARRHNRLSVLPHLVSEKLAKSQEGFFSFVLVNNGLGPAVIRSFKVSVDGSIIEGGSMSKIEAAVKELPLNQKFEPIYNDLGAGYVVASGEKTTILELKFIEYDPNQWPSINEALNRMELIISYESFYGDKYRFTN